MRKEQAETLIAKLEAAFQRGLPEDTTQIYLEKLMTLPFSTGLKRVDHLISTSTFMPKIAELMRQTDSEAAQINTMVEEGKWLDSPAGRYSLFYNQKLLEMDDREYQDYLQDPAARARMDAKMRHEYVQGRRAE